MSDRTYFWLTLLGGYFGLHKFAKKDFKMGLVYLFTLGLFCFGWIIDSINAYTKMNKSKPTAMQYFGNNVKALPQTPKVRVNSTVELELQRVDAMSVNGFDFEHYCADLLLKNGYSKAEVTQGCGDYGIDILAEKDGVTYAVQCKCYSNSVGNKSVQEAYSGKEFYKCMVAAVLTNNYFTPAAVETAKETRVLLWDRTILAALIDKSMARVG